MSGRIRIGTRGSKLALWQANAVARKLTEAGYTHELVTISTTGDKRTDVSLATLGGKGLFIKELEEALERDEIDLAVHSLKDVPSIVSPQFVLAGFLERADPRDAWVQPAGIAITQLEGGSVVGTSSPRRDAQLVDMYPQLKIEPIRGNVDTRIEKARTGQFAGVVLACAGLTRLGRAAEITSLFTIDEMVPAAGQGIVAMECLSSNRLAVEASAQINDDDSASAARCERGVLQKFGTQLDCYSAIAVHAEVRAQITVRAFAGDGKRTVRVRRSGDRPDDLIDAVYAELIKAGAPEMITGARN